MGGPAELGKVPVRLEKIQSWETRLKMGSDEQVHQTPEYELTPVLADSLGSEESLLLTPILTESLGVK